jgi:two-component system chemotaxis response regulator CheY
MEIWAMARILIADQSAAFRRAAQYLFESLGHAVLCARNGMETLDLSKETLPDLIIVDARLEGFEGTVLVEKLRAMPSSRRPCIFFVAENGGPASIRAALDAGADDYLIKPFDRELVAFKLAQAKARGHLVERPPVTKLVQDNSSSWRFRTFGKAV